MNENKIIVGYAVVDSTTVTPIYERIEGRSGDSKELIFLSSGDDIEALFGFEGVELKGFEETSIDSISYRAEASSKLEADPTLIGIIFTTDGYIKFSDTICFDAVKVSEDGTESSFDDYVDTSILDDDERLDVLMEYFNS